MFRYSFYKRPVVENSQINNVSVFVRQSYLQIQDMLKEKGIKLNFNKEEDLQMFIKMVTENVTVSLKQENKGTESVTDYKNPVKLTYTRSNLNRGFILWFICNLCGKRVRYLYIPPSSEVMACRSCHRLAYKSQNDNPRVYIPPLKQNVIFGN